MYIAERFEAVMSMPERARKRLSHHGAVGVLAWLTYFNPTAIYRFYSVGMIHSMSPWLVSSCGPARWSRPPWYTTWLWQWSLHHGRLASCSGSAAWQSDLIFGFNVFWRLCFQFEYVLLCASCFHSGLLQCAIIVQSEIWWRPYLFSTMPVRGQRRKLASWCGYAQSRGFLARSSTSFWKTLSRHSSYSSSNASFHHVPKSLGLSVKCFCMFLPADRKPRS
jgi:hypothetical protein